MLRCRRLRRSSESRDVINWTGLKAPTIFTDRLIGAKSSESKSARSCILHEFYTMQRSSLTRKKLISSVPWQKQQLQEATLQRDNNALDHRRPQHGNKTPDALSHQQHLRVEPVTGRLQTNRQLLTILYFLSRIISGAIQPSVPAVPDRCEKDKRPGTSFLQRPKSDMTTRCLARLLGTDTRMLEGFTSRWTARQTKSEHERCSRRSEHF